MYPASNVHCLFKENLPETPDTSDDCATTSIARRSSRPMPWWKMHNGFPNDPIIRTVARRAGQSVPLAFTVMVCLYNFANQVEPRGSVEGFDAENVANFYDVDQADVEAVVSAFLSKGWIADGRIANWEATQPARDEAPSTDRVRAHRERKAAEAATAGNAVKRHATDRERVEVEEDKEVEESSPRIARPAVADHVAFDTFWSAYPHKVGKPAARKAFAPALKRAGGDLTRLMDGLARYQLSKPADRAWCNPATFLTQDRFDDVPATAAPAPVRNPSFTPTTLSRAGGDEALARKLQTGAAF